MPRTQRPRNVTPTGPPVTKAHPTAAATLFGQPIAEPLRHLFGHYPIPGRLSEFHLRRFRASNRAKVFVERNILFKEGELPIGIFVILEGRVKMSMTSSEGKTLVLGFFGSGSVIGLAANILGRLNGATAEAVETTGAIFVPRRELLGEIQANATAAWQIAQLVSENCFFLMSKLRTVDLSESAPQMVARCLLGLIAHGATHDGELEQLHLSQEAIAQMVGLSRETVSRQLSRLREKGMLDWKRTDFIIHDRQALERLADNPEEAA
jgi:CRP/FNR family cyclic AMP-dependent transcriptional regulator